MTKWLLLMVWLLAPCAAFAAEPFARASVEGDGKIVPGQQVRVDVDVFVPNFFTSPPQFPLFDLPNALVTLPAERSQNVTQTIDGVQYSGIRKAYSIVPQDSGTFTLPEFDISLGYSVDGKPTAGTVRMPSVSFTVAATDTSDQTPLTIAASNLAIAQTFDHDAQSLKVGDALVRTITVSAEDTQAMLFPPVDVGLASGLHQYEKSPKIEDGIAVGRESSSRRTQTVIYTADQDGSFVIPAVSYTWFDVASRETKVASLPPVAVTVSGAATETAIKPMLDTVVRETPHARRQKIALAILFVLAAGALVWILRRILPTVVGTFREARQRRLASPRHQLLLLRRTIKSGSEAEIYAGLHHWSRRLGYRTIEDWIRDGPLGLRQQVDILSRKLFRSGGETVDRQALAANVQLRTARASAKPSALPPLNP